MRTKIEDNEDKKKIKIKKDQGHTCYISIDWGLDL